jgi:hypothetical protein
VGAINLGSWSFPARWTEREVIMSEATLFSFGAVIFLIVFTGATLYGMAAMKEMQDRGK